MDFMKTILTNKPFPIKLQSNLMRSKCKNGLSFSRMRSTPKATGLKSKKVKDFEKVQLKMKMRNFAICMFLTWGGMTILGNFLKVLGTQGSCQKGWMLH